MSRLSYGETWGAVLWEGRSLFDASPLVVIATLCNGVQYQPDRRRDITIVAHGFGSQLAGYRHMRTGTPPSVVGHRLRERKRLSRLAGEVSP